LPEFLLFTIQRLEDCLSLIIPKTKYIALQTITVETSLLMKLTDHRRDGSCHKGVVSQFITRTRINKQKEKDIYVNNKIPV
jgi:hypothetical protein